MAFTEYPFRLLRCRASGKPSQPLPNMLIDLIGTSPLGCELFLVLSVKYTCRRYWYRLLGIGFEEGQFREIQIVSSHLPIEAAGVFYCPSIQEETY